MPTVRPLLAALAAALLGACGGSGDGDGELPDSFRFTVDNATAPCVPDTMTVTGAREAVPAIDARISGIALSCSAAAEADNAWSIMCVDAQNPDVYSIEVRLAHSLDAGEVAINHLSAACDITLPMLTVEVLTP